MTFLGPIFVQALKLVSWFVDIWAKDQKTKEEWAKAVEEARRRYQKAEAGDATDIKMDYDKLKDDLRNGKHKL